MDRDSVLLLAALFVSLLTFGGCYLVGLAVSAAWPKLRPSASKRPRAWLVALVLWAVLGLPARFIFSPAANDVAPPPALVGPPGP